MAGGAHPGRTGDRRADRAPPTSHAAVLTAPRTGEDPLLRACRGRDSEDLLIIREGGVREDAGAGRPEGSIAPSCLHPACEVLTPFVPALGPVSLF